MTRVLVVGDPYYRAEAFARVFAARPWGERARYTDVVEAGSFVPRSRSERAIREYIGTPEQVIAQLEDDDVLVVHGAPVTDEVLEAGPYVRLICCARGGPVNVDMGAAAKRGIPVITTPGKNAESVADLTLGFMIMLARHVPRAARDVRGRGGIGDSTFDGSSYFGHELRGRTLGLVGYGLVGRAVARQATGLGIITLTFDPFVAPETCEADGVRPVDTLTELLRASDVVSVHARATEQNENLFDAERFAQMKSGAWFINTARETLVDEAALLNALREERLGGAALDVLRPRRLRGRPGPLTQLENVIITPHIGGATHETLARGASMIAEEIGRFTAGEPLRHIADPSLA
ncbi:MAG: NAD(P)-dependent oxidoreductase [Solirubrobacteraceae bacterium]